ncbi:MAG TPA: hypothetical protein DIT10_07090 [Chryseobacterium sp.]|nr:hypothetical protein [Chryseobacterium sp.]
MKKVILGVILAYSISTSCSKDENFSDKSATLNSSILNNTNGKTAIGKEYTQQLLYLDAHTDFMTLNVENDLSHKMNDPKIDWKTINALYNPDLNTASKQYLIYILLAKKDLLGIQNTTPTQEQANLIINYAKELVKTKYFGYCLLYNTLETLNTDAKNAQLVKDLSKQIVVDSGTEKFHADFISRPEGRDPYINKVKEDYTYLDKIKHLQ